MQIFTSSWTVLGDEIVADIVDESSEHAVPIAAQAVSGAISRVHNVAGGLHLTRWTMGVRRDHSLVALSFNGEVFDGTCVLVAMLKALQQDEGGWSLEIWAASNE